MGRKNWIRRLAAIRDMRRSREMVFRLTAGGHVCWSKTLSQIPDRRFWRRPACCGQIGGSWERRFWLAFGRHRVGPSDPFALRIDGAADASRQPVGKRPGGSGCHGLEIHRRHGIDGRRSAGSAKLRSAVCGHSAQPHHSGPHCRTFPSEKCLRRQTR